MLIAGAVVLGCGLIAWSIFFVGRRIARVLWGLLVVAEKDDIQRDTLQRQREHLFGDKVTPGAQRERR